MNIKEHWLLAVVDLRKEAGTNGIYFINSCKGSLPK
jgi:hypothetical protein